MSLRFRVPRRKFETISEFYESGGTIMKRALLFLQLLPALIVAQVTLAADTVPTDIQLPGTQPTEISNLESPDKCDNCHGGYNSSVEPAHNWRGSMMAHAGRDPIFWSTLAVAEQDFDGVGDLCIRCHSTAGWLAGRSTPTDGSGLAAGDSDGVECDYCHKLTNPDDSEHIGQMTAPFIANDGVEGYYGSGMSSMWGGADKLGPYDNADARHQFMRSKFHRDRDFCGTCHDVSNSVTGDLAHNHGQMLDPSTVTASGDLGSPVVGKAAFNNPPYAYGIVERTFSEYKAGQISETPVDDFDILPGLPRGGVLEAIYLAATKGETQSANYTNPDMPRYYSCQTCHMRPVTGEGANKRGVPTRTDLPLHDMTGGNYWMPQAIQYLDSQGKLRLGGGLSAGVIQAMNDGILRAKEQLELAATLDINGNSVTVTNHTGHKLITGYPEGRRMWLNIKWFDAANGLLREDGAYGALSPVTVNGVGFTPNSLLDLSGANTRIWEAHMGMTTEWAQQLVDLGYPPDLPLSFNRLSGGVQETLGELAARAPGSAAETFHFALNNIVVHDNRIPPYQMSYNIAKQRNALPVPEDQYSGGAPDTVYDHFDVVDLNPPAGAARADIKLMYQPTSWEYIQFVALANDGNSAFLGEEGANMLDAWLHTGMAEPFVMETATWGDSSGSACQVAQPVLGEAVAGDKQVTLGWQALADGNVTGYSVYYDQAGKAQWVADSDCLTGACSYTDLNLTNDQTYCYKLTTRTAGCESEFSNILCATPRQPGQQQTASVTGLETGYWVVSGKGKNAIQTFLLATDFAQGDEIVFRAVITDDAGQAVKNASFELAISGPETLTLTSAGSDASGLATATWATQAPDRKGQGGTLTGTYSAAVSGLNAGSLSWDEVVVKAEFNIAGQ